MASDNRALALHDASLPEAETQNEIQGFSGFHSWEKKYHPLYMSYFEDNTKTETGVPVQVSHAGIAQNPGKSHKMGNKRKPNHIEVEYECDLGSRRVSRNSRGTGESGKMDSRKFEFLLEKLKERFPKEQIKDFVFFDSLWFSFYINRRLKAKVLNWIKKKDIFSKKYVFVPIVIWSHWSLLILCHFDERPNATNTNRCMLLLDSLRNPNLERVKSGIRSFIFDIFRSENREDEQDLIGKIPLHIPKVPQQKTGTECGIFVLHYINRFMQGAPHTFTSEGGYPSSMKQDWFTYDEFDRFAQGLKIYDQEYDSSSF